MLQSKRTTPLLAVLGAVALMTVSAPAFAQNSTDTSTAAASASNTTEGTAPAADSSGDVSNGGQVAAPTSIKAGVANGPVGMFLGATPVVQTVMAGLLVASIVSWTILIIKLVNMALLNRQTTKFLEAFRDARSITDMNRVATQEEFEGNPFADMAAAASNEVELSRQAGLSVTGEHRGSTINRASLAVSGVQATIGKRLSSGMQFLASVGSSGPFIGLFGTVYGIMNSFIGIAKTNTTNLAVVAPGIAEALLATGIGLFAAIPSVIFYNYFQTQIAGYGTRTEGFIVELMNAISRQLDRGA
ncbi:tonB-system energizer ExbB [Caulobacter sp. S45]|uniref:tonB-system energizer ExbB n=1 Tax=Caulobacter sp. S45 TaxID=1641861 RepID=UPI001576E51A|nr:tonB-system energizer ExbB [Caulobacter sp. S45]